MYFTRAGADGDDVASDPWHVACASATLPVASAHTPARSAAATLPLRAGGLARTGLPARASDRVHPAPKMKSRFVQNPTVYAAALMLGIGGWLVLTSPDGSSGRSGDAHPAPQSARAAQGARVAQAARAAQSRPLPRFELDTLPGERAAFMLAAQSAWVYVEREYQPATGLVNSVAAYPYATIWDIASGLAALYCGNRLGLLEDDEYDRRMRLALNTLGRLRLYDGIAFSKNYSTRTGVIAGRDDRDWRAAGRGTGWSATDIGRMLIWLHVIRTNQPKYAPRIDSIVARLDMTELVKDGYLWGSTLTLNGRELKYVEGRIPYEQYAAAGYALWGHRAEQALNPALNAIPITVLGVPLVADRRGQDHLTSEPFVLHGLEVGWSPPLRDLSMRMLEVQRERFRRTKQVTMVSEDAIPRPPYYFYYYNVNLQGKTFVVSAQGSNNASRTPRWVSAKAAWGWHALLPNDYTRIALRTVADARRTTGWSSGVYESDGRSTGGENVNTAAVILEAALYRMTGRPLAAPPPRTAR